MSAPHDPRQKMLADTLDGEWSAGPAAQMAARAAAHARRRRATRRAVGAVTSAAMLVIVAFFAFQPRRLAKNLPPIEPAQGLSVPGYTIISEEQLLGSPAPLLILPDESGAKKIVLLSR